MTLHDNRFYLDVLHGHTQGEGREFYHSNEVPNDVSSDRDPILYSEYIVKVFPCPSELFPKSAVLWGPEPNLGLSLGCVFQWVILLLREKFPGWMLRRLDRKGWTLSAEV